MCVRFISLPLLCSKSSIWCTFFLLETAYIKGRQKIWSLSYRILHYHVPYTTILLITVNTHTNISNFCKLTILISTVIELACGEYGQANVDMMVKATQNGNSLAYFDRPDLLPSLETLREKNGLDEQDVLKDNSKLERTSAYNQLKVLLGRGFLKSKRDSVSFRFWNCCQGLMMVFLCRCLPTCESV